MGNTCIKLCAVRTIQVKGLGGVGGGGPGTPVMPCSGVPSRKPASSFIPLTIHSVLGRTPLLYISPGYRHRRSGRVSTCPYHSIRPGQIPSRLFPLRVRNLNANLVEIRLQAVFTLATIRPSHCTSRTLRIVFSRKGHLFGSHRTHLQGHTGSLEVKKKYAC